MLLKNIYLMGSSLRDFAYDMETSSFTTFDIIVETDYSQKFEEFLNKKIGKVYRNSFGNLRVCFNNYSWIEIKVIDTKLKNIYKNFIEFNFDSFIYDLLKNEFVFYDNLYEESLKKIERVGKVLHPSRGVRRSLERERNENNFRSRISFYKNITIEEAFRKLDLNFFMENNTKKNTFGKQQLLLFLEEIKKF